MRENENKQQHKQGYDDPDAIFRFDRRFVSCVSSSAYGRDESDELRRI